MTKEPGQRWPMSQVRDFLDGGPLAAPVYADQAGTGPRRSLRRAAPPHDRRPSRRSGTAAAPLRHPRQRTAAPVHRRGPGGAILGVLAAHSRSSCCSSCSPGCSVRSTRQDRRCRLRHRRRPRRPRGSEETASTPSSVRPRSAGRGHAGLHQRLRCARRRGPAGVMGAADARVPGGQRQLRPVPEVLGPVVLGRRGQHRGRPRHTHRQLPITYDREDGESTTDDVSLVLEEMATAGS